MDELMAKDIKVFPQHTNRASSLGDPCIRKLVYARTHWEHAEPHSVKSQYIFSEGNLQESAVLATLAKAGIQVVNQQQSFVWREHQITGSSDGFILDGDNKYPLEIKSMNPFIWDSIDTSTNESLLSTLNKKPWSKKYIPQLVLYMLMSNFETGVFLFKNKTSGQLKQAYIHLSDNLDLGEELIQKADCINTHIEKKTLPDQIYDTDECNFCPFKHICCPDMITDGLEFVDNAELETALDRMEELKPISKEYKDLDDYVKTAVKGKQLSVGKYIISGKWIDVKAQTELSPARRDWRRSIKKLGD